ncbi:hypothetical protein ACFYO2_04875 [Streptomyces sp. NPDC006602]|uniref:hypothetical protein n=1 Tax=Streptomyces sp. NPDC006602 TaxID=3364751 RepID=UPI0036A32300
MHSSASTARVAPPRQEKPGGRRHARAAVTSLIVLAALASCGGSPREEPSSSPTDAGAGITGVVVLWPTCPVEGIPEQREDDCRGLPTEATLRVRDRGADTVAATVHVGQDGRFRVALRPSEYTVTSEAPGTEYCHPVDVTVRSGEYTDVVVKCDTGLR